MSEASLSGWVDAPVPIGHRVESLIGWGECEDSSQIVAAPHVQLAPSESGSEEFISEQKWLGLTPRVGAHSP
jgi:hypothetical protein